MAWSQTQVNIQTESDEFNSKLEVTVEYLCPFHIPGVGRLFGTKDSSGNYVNRVVSTVVIEKEGHKSQNQELGIDYYAPAGAGALNEDSAHLSKLRDALVQAKLAEDTYTNYPRDVKAGDPIEDGWRRDSQHRFQSGLAATIYSRTRNGITEFSIAFRGTELTKEAIIRDAQANVRNYALGYSSQYYGAEHLIRELQSVNPNAKIEVTGHSLGGSVAAHVANKFGLEATIFNAAGPNPLRELSAVIGESIGLPGIKGRITEFRHRQDPLTRMDIGRPWTNSRISVGDRASGPGPYSIEDIKKYHKIAEFIAALEREISALESAASANAQKDLYPIHNTH